MTIIPKSSIGIQISERSIKFAELKRKKTIRLGACGEIAVPEGVIESGIIRNEKKLENIISDLRKKFKIKAAHFSVPEEQFQPFRLTIPKMNNRGAHETIELKIRDYVSLEGKDFKFDHKIIREGINSYEIEISAIHPLSKISYPDVIRLAGIKAESFEPEAEALRRAFIRRGDEENYMIVHFGENRTLIAVCGEKRVRYQASFMMSANSVNRMIETGNLSILRSEVDRHYVAWQSFIGRHKHAAVKNIILSGEANLEEIAEYLEKGLRLPVLPGNAWANILRSEDEIPEMTHKESLRFAPVLGLALKGIK